VRNKRKGELNRLLKLLYFYNTQGREKYNVKNQDDKYKLSLLIRISFDPNT